MKFPVASEHEEQKALIQWCRLSARQHPELNWILAIPNGGARHPAIAKKLKAEGVVAGVPDLLLPVARRGYHSLFIEMKRPDGRPSDVREDQKGWIDYLISEGYYACVCFGQDQAREVIMWYLENDRDG